MLHTIQFGALLSLSIILAHLLGCDTSSFGKTALCVLQGICVDRASCRYHPPQALKNASTCKNSISCCLPSAQRLLTAAAAAAAAAILPLQLWLSKALS